MNEWIVPLAGLLLFLLLCPGSLVLAWLHNRKTEAKRWKVRKPMTALPERLFCLSVDLP